LTGALTPYQVTANCIIPGFIKTPRPTILQKENLAGASSTVPFEKYGEIEDITEALKFLAGETLHVKGGMSVAPLRT